jgi:predicted butyrate kinase (DUF1464 family)
VRVAGTDPGTSSLDLLILDDGVVAEQCRFTPDDLQADLAAPIRWLVERGPFDLVAGPSGYGLPLVRAMDCSERDLALMALVRPEERATSQGVVKFSSLLREFCRAPVPVVFLPGVIHLATVPPHRKFNRIDLGTADKLCVAALALAQAAQRGEPAGTFCVVELGSAFTALIVVELGRVVDGLGGTSGPAGWRSAGSWDGEMAYLLSPLGKLDLFSGGAAYCADPAEGEAWLCESVVKAVVGVQAICPFAEILLSGRLLETEPRLTDRLVQALAQFGRVELLESWPGAWVKQAAQGAALLADGLAGGTCQELVAQLELRQATGSVLDWLKHPRAELVRKAWE